jgi:hypothetical protein
MALWPIFRSAAAGLVPHVRFKVLLVARALKIGQIADGGMPPTYETMHYALVAP